MTRRERSAGLLAMALACVQVVGCLARDVPLRFEAPPEPVYSPARVFILTLDSGAQATVTVVEVLEESR